MATHQQPHSTEKILDLPRSIHPCDEDGSGIILHHYCAQHTKLKEKSVLSRNAFSLVISGHKTMHFAEKTVNVDGRKIHMLSEGHCIGSVMISPNKPFESVLLFFRNDILVDFYSANAKLIDNLQKTRKKESEPYIEFTKDEFIINYTNSLLTMLCKNGRLSEQMKLLKLNELLLYLLENHTTTFLSFRHGASLRTEELLLKKVVETNKYNNLMVDELAFLCNMTASTFKRQFKRMYNTSPRAWFNEQRMILAGKLIRERNAKPGEVWHKLGFETHTGFTRSFKKHYGDLPKEFARKMAHSE
jgi:AraC family transcriptional regulator, exoenzyme S synthesis regulatory protein ExsA